MKRRLGIAIGAGIVASALGIGLTIAPAYAQATNQLSTDEGASSLCMNRDQGTTGYGTPVIAYNCGDDNNDFYVKPLSKMCGPSGTVTDTCPFTVGSGLNGAYYGFKIGAVYAYNEGKCAGGDGELDSNAKLEACPDDYGNGGGWSTIVIEVPSRGASPTYYVLTNRNWSDYNWNNSNCYGISCSAVDGKVGYRAPVSMSVLDQAVQGGRIENAAGSNIWAELTYA